MTIKSIIALFQKPKPTPIESTRTAAQWRSEVVSPGYQASSVDTARWRRAVLKQWSRLNRFTPRLCWSLPLDDRTGRRDHWVLFLSGGGWDFLAEVRTIVRNHHRLMMIAPPLASVVRQSISVTSDFEFSVSRRAIIGFGVVYMAESDDFISFGPSPMIAIQLLCRQHREVTMRITTSPIRHLPPSPVVIPQKPTLGPNTFTEASQRRSKQ